jgi:hypothetical protein
MNGYWIFAIGVIVGGFGGVLLAGLCDAAHRGDHDQEVTQAYWDGFDAGQSNHWNIRYNPEIGRVQAIDDWQGWPADREGR